MGKAARIDANNGLAADVEPAVAADSRLKLLGFTIGDAGSAACEVRIMHGATVAGGVNLGRVWVPADGSETVWFGPDGIACPDGISIDHIAGTPDVSLYYEYKGEQRA